MDSERFEAAIDAIKPTAQKIDDFGAMLVASHCSCPHSRIDGQRCGLAVARGPASPFKYQASPAKKQAIPRLLADNRVKLHGQQHYLAATIPRFI
jgi:hypothetical protein